MERGAEVSEDIDARVAAYFTPVVAMGMGIALLAVDAIVNEATPIR